MKQQGVHLGKGGCAHILPNIRDKREPSQSPRRKGFFLYVFPLVSLSTVRKTGQAAIQGQAAGSESFVSRSQAERNAARLSV